MIARPNANPDTRRRQLLAACAAGLSGIARNARAQAAARPMRLMWIGSTPPPSQTYTRAFLERLRELGYEDGRSLNLQFRSILGASGSSQALAREVAAFDADVLFAPGSDTGLKLAVAAGGSRPVVIIANDYDPVSTGHVRSMARPGGRVTGVSSLQAELPAKRMAVLRELLPRLRRTAVLADVSTQGQLPLTRDAARQLDIELVVQDLRRQPYDMPAAFAAFATERAEALVALSSGLFVPHRQQIVELAAKHQLPSVFNNDLWVDAGGLLSYGPNFTVNYRRAAEIVVRVHQGASPADTPIEQPNVVEMALNLRTARALGLAIPASIRLRAEKIVE